MTNLGAIVDQLHHEIEDTAWTNITDAEAQMGTLVTDDTRDALTLGIRHGLLATLQVLIGHGILDTLNS